MGECINIKAQRDRERERDRRNLVLTLQARRPVFGRDKAAELIEDDSSPEPIELARLALPASFAAATEVLLSLLPRNPDNKFQHFDPCPDLLDRFGGNVLPFRLAVGFKAITHPDGVIIPTLTSAHIHALAASPDEVRRRGARLTLLLLCESLPEPWRDLNPEERAAYVLGHLCRIVRGRAGL
jgi:hypothetical protein